MKCSREKILSSQKCFVFLFFFQNEYGEGNVSSSNKTTNPGWTHTDEPGILKLPR
uniref:Uncharacterized protein n=1 Tax=Anguilla anguilla TaxID=7936 RepID=A0A0E9SP65_ANGAN